MLKYQNSRDLITLHRWCWRINETCCHFQLDNFSHMVTCVCISKNAKSEKFVKTTHTSALEEKAGMSPISVQCSWCLACFSFHLRSLQEDVRTIGTHPGKVTLMTLTFFCFHTKLRKKNKVCVFAGGLQKGEVTESKTPQESEREFIARGHLFKVKMVQSRCSTDDSQKKRNRVQQMCVSKYQCFQLPEVSTSSTLSLWCKNHRRKASGAIPNQKTLELIPRVNVQNTLSSQRQLWPRLLPDTFRPNEVEILARDKNYFPDCREGC